MLRMSTMMSSRHGRRVAGSAGSTVSSGSSSIVLGTTACCAYGGWWLLSSSSSSSSTVRHNPHTTTATTTQCSSSTTTTTTTTSLQPYYENQKNNDTTAIIVPTLQAVNRARRLAQTVVSMVWDYQVAKWRFSSSLWWLSTTPDNDSHDDSHDYHHWQMRVAQRKQILQEAQHEYTTTTPDRRAELELSPEERSTRTKERQAEQRANVRSAAESLGEAEEMLATIGGDPVHYKAAQKLLALCRQNGGVYVKIGQHLANLDYLIPSEYIAVLAALYDDAPVSSYEDVREVIREELGRYPEEVFGEFSSVPLASASLAQVHVARERGTGRTLAIKVQHRGLGETSVGDLIALAAAVRLVDGLFQDFTWAWLCEEIMPQLPLELDFTNEGRNAERAAAHIKTTGLDCVVPEVIWDKTTSRVLSMQFEEGFKSTNLKDIKEAGLKTRDISKLISSVFNAQVFQSGFVHCDPHPANVLIRPHPLKKGQPQMVLVDHGLYKQIDDEFRVTYAELWKSLLVADIPGIQVASQKLGVGKMYPLLAGMLTTRPFDETIERSKSKSSISSVVVTNNNTASNNTTNAAGDKAMIQGYAQRYIREIFALLDVVPRQMLLLFKMNDCLRHVDFALGSPPSNSLVVAGRYAVEAVYEDRRRTALGRLDRVRLWWLHRVSVLWRIQAYEWATTVWWWWCSSGNN